MTDEMGAGGLTVVVIAGAVARAYEAAALTAILPRVLENVVPMRSEIERQELLVPRAVDGAGKAPVEAIEGLHRAERGALGA